MNIFYLDRDPKIAAQLACDKHVVKMILESAQMLCTAHRVLDGDEPADHGGMYKMVHKKVQGGSQGGAFSSRRTYGDNCGWTASTLLTYNDRQKCSGHGKWKAVDHTSFSSREFSKRDSQKWSHRRQDNARLFRLHASQTFPSNTEKTR